MICTIHMPIIHMDAHRGIAENLYYVYFHSLKFIVLSIKISHKVLRRPEKLIAAFSI